MKNRKIKKFVAVLTLIVSLLTVQTLELTAMASTGTPDFTNPAIVVSSFADLQSAIDTASDGTVIGIDSIIPIDSPNVILGSEDGSKHVYIVRMNADSYLWLTQITNLTICNITLDGNSSQLIGNNPMLYVDGTLNLNDSVIQNCSGVSNGAIYVTDNGTFNATVTNFSNNSAISGGHIENYGTVTLNGCSLKNGSAQGDGGAIYNGRNATIQNCKIVGNQAGLTGGAIHNADSLSISQSVIYGNTATYGYDIANNVNYTSLSNDNLADVMSLYEAEGVIPVEWRYDGPATEEELNQAGIYNVNVYNPQSLMRLVLEEENGDESDEGAGDNGDEGTSGDDMESGGSSEDNTETDDGIGDTGNTEEPGNTEDDNTAGDSGNMDDSENTGNTDNSGESEDTGNTESDDNIEDSDNSENAGNQENDGSTTNPGNESGSNTEDGGNIGEDSGMTDDSNDNSDTGNQDSTTDNTDDNSDTGNQDNTTDNSNDNNNSENQDNTAGDSGDNDIPNDDSDDTSNSVTGGDVIINNDESSSIITNNNTNTTTEDNSSVSNNTDNYEDKSSTTNTTTTTNNYYTYNTPQDSNETERTNDTNRASSTAVIEQQVQTVNGNSTSESTGVQLLDNLTLDLHGVDVIYEIVDGVPKITISNEKVIAEQAITEETAQARIQEPMAENAINIASSAGNLENNTVSINWYEIIKMILLAAILIVVIYKPSEKKVLS